MRLLRNFRELCYLRCMDEFRLRRLVSQGEHSQLEFKESPGKDIAVVIASLANAEGGRILLGVSDKGEIVGCPLSNSERAALARAGRDCDPSVEVAIFHLPESDVTILDVPQSLIKPVRCSQGYFVREYATTRRLKSEEVGEMTRKSFPPVFENMLCEKFVYPDDFSFEKLETFTEMSKLSSDLSPEDILLNLGIAEKDGKELKLNNVAVIFFAKHPKRFFIQAFITCVVYNGNGKAVIVDRHDLEDGIIADIEAAMTFAKRNMRVAEKIVNRYRTDIYEYPPEAVKEALVNACAHRDWGQRGGHITLEIYPDKLLVISPGGLPEGVTLQNIEHTSVRRNSVICEMLHRAGLGERIGSGIKKMKQICLDGGYEPPTYDAAQHYFTAAFTPHPRTARR